ncbi:MAG: type VI secretion system ATPase TssH, partial [Halieaceae bacterium]|nr:type VI secretion system ATPase TssH [Halieaceae bacterium]
MRMDKLTNALQQALGDAQSLAVGRNHSMIEPAHLLSAFLNQSRGAITPLLRKTGANLVALKSSVTDALAKVPVLADTAGDVQGSQALGRLLNRADKLSQDRGDAFISNDIVLLAMVEKNSPLSRMMVDAGIIETALKTAIEQVRGSDSVQSADAEEHRQALEKYTV